MAPVVKSEAKTEHQDESKNKALESKPVKDQNSPQVKPKEEKKKDSTVSFAQTKPIDIPESASDLL